MSEYYALIKAKLEGNLQAEINKQKYTVPLKIDANKLKTQVGQLENQLNRLKIANKDAFANSDAVKSQLANVMQLQEGVKNNTVSLGEYKVGYGELNNEVLRYNKNSSAVIQNTDNIGTSFQKALIKITQWGVATTLIYGSLRQLKLGIQYVEDLNKAMTNIGLVTGQMTSELSGMASEFNSMAKELGATTLDMAEGATEWIRAGKTELETMELLKNSTMLAKLGNLEASDSTTKLTAITNAYNVSARDSISIIDMLIGLDNAFATSTGEIADAMEESSSMAKQAGVNYQDLASYITVVSSVTRQSGDTIGNAMKSILARMVQVKAGADFDEEGESINNVEKVLLKYGITLRDTNNSFRDMSDVLSDAAEKYNELGVANNTVAQGQITSALAGLRQANYLAALFQNWDKVTQAQGIATNSAGLAAERYEIYLQSLEAASNNLKSSWEKLWMESISEEAISNIINGLSKILDFISGTGGLIPSIALLGGAFLVWKDIAIGVSAVNGIVSLSFDSLLGPIGLVIAAIGGLIMIINAIDTPAEKVAKLNSEISELDSTISNLESKKETIASLSQEFLDLKDNTNKSIEEQKRFNQLQNDLKDILPTIAGYYDQSGNFVITDEALVSNQAYLDLLIQQIDAQKALRSLALSEEIGATIKGFGKESSTIGKQAELLNKISMYKSMGEAGGYEAGRYLSLDEDKIKESLEKAKLAQAEYIQWAIDNWEYFSDADKKLIEESGEFGEQIADIMSGVADSIDAPEISDKIEEVSGAMESLTSATSILNSATKEQIDNGYISAQTAMELVDANSMLAQYLTQTANGYLFDAEAARQAVYAEMQHMMVIAKIPAAALAAANGNYLFAQSAIATAQATEKQKAKMLDLLKLYAAMGTSISLPSVSGGGGGGSSESPQKKAIDAAIKALEKQKKALQDRLDEFKKYIEAQKESLRLQKEEADFKDEIAKKTKSLAKLKTQIALLALDDSEEARQQRLDLEDEAAELEEEITEDKEDRKYDLKIEALDRLQKEFEDNINAQIDLISQQIDNYREQQQAINDNAGAVGGLTNAIGLLGSQSSIVYSIMSLEQIAMLRLSESQKKMIEENIKKWEEEGKKIEEIMQLAIQYANYLKTLKLSVNAEGFEYYEEDYGNPYGHGGSYIKSNAYHNGGIVESHHNGRFAGGLQSNEVFAKLIKGEFVLTEGQMRNFLTGVLPKTIAYAENMGSSYGDIDISMPIVIQGNADEKVLNNLKKEIFSNMNDILRTRGIKRTATNYSF